jgi:predicted nucleic acid-binding protein
VILVDSNVILDVVTPDPIWESWSAPTMKSHARTELLVINPIIYAEISVSFFDMEKLDISLSLMQLALISIPREAAFRAGKAFLQYKKQEGKKTNVLPDFFIGAHAAVLGCSLLTRDTRRYATYFPTVRLITPSP